MIDANQVWEVDEAIQWSMRSRSSIHGGSRNLSVPTIFWGMEESHERFEPIRVATGEHAHNRIMFKQFIASDAIDVAQPDACRLGGLNEVLACCCSRQNSESPFARMPVVLVYANMRNISR